MIPFVILFILIAFIFFIVTLVISDNYLLYFSSIILTLVGIYTMTNGLLNLNDWFTQSLSVVFIGIGMYVMVTSSLNLLNLDED